jgi:phage N-6-adenine-methyltransferase
MTVPNFSFSSKNSEWSTPVEYVKAVRDVLGYIDLDPASSEETNKTVKADQFFDISRNGLSQDWNAKTIFLNPPYGFTDLDGKKVSSVDVWISKMIDEFQQHHFSYGILLVNASIDSSWFKQLWNFPICFTDHRIKFNGINGKGKQPTKGSAFVFFIDPSLDNFEYVAFCDQFQKSFLKFGQVVLPPSYYYRIL